MALKGSALDFLSGAATTVGQGISDAQANRARKLEEDRLRRLKEMEAERKGGRVGGRDTSRADEYSRGRLQAGQTTVKSPQEGGGNILSRTAGAVRDKAGDVAGAAGRKVKGAAGAINRAIRGPRETTTATSPAGFDDTVPNIGRGQPKPLSERKIDTSRAD